MKGALSQEEEIGILLRAAAGVQTREFYVDPRPLRRVVPMDGATDELPYVPVGPEQAMVPARSGYASKLLVVRECTIEISADRHRRCPSRPKRRSAALVGLSSMSSPRSPRMNGTIRIDLEQRPAASLLPDHESGAPVAWLEAV